MLPSASVDPAGNDDRARGGDSAHSGDRPAGERVPAGADVTELDGGDLSCARLLVLLRDRAATLPDGTVVHLTTTDPVAPIDLPVWCRMTGHEYLGPVEGRARPTYGVRISASAAPTLADRPWHRA